MATFTSIKGNLGVKLIITETSQSIPNNTTTISYSARVYKTGNHNPFNNYTQTPFKLVINGEVIFNQKANYDLRDWTADYRLSRTEQVITSGTRTIKHNDNGSKSISASWSGDFTSTGTIYGYGSVLASGTMNLTDIPRVSRASLSKVNFNFGELVTLTTNRRSNNFTHSASYVVGGVETLLATDIGVSKNIAIPISRANSIPNSSSESMNIRVKTFSGTTEVGSHDIPVTVNVPSTVIPKVDGVSLSETVSNANIFSNNNSNYIRGISKVKATAINARGEYGSTINQYEFRLKDNTSYNGVSKSNNFTFGVLNIPAQGSQLYKFQCRVRDSRGRYSNWVDSSDVRFHYYTPPTINTPTLSRDGTVLSVERTYSVQSIMENGVERNVGNLSFQTRPKGSSSWTSNGGAKHTGISLNKSSDPLLGVFLENVAYEVQGILSDKLSTVYSGIAVSGAAFVTLEVLLGTGIGVGRSPIAGNGNLQVGSGGMSIDGSLYVEGGIEPKMLPLNTDLNSITQPGFYYSPYNAHVETMANRPTGNAFSMLVMRHAGVVQILTEYMTSGAKTFIRNYYDSWGSWTTVMNENAVKTLLAGSSSNFDSNTFIQMVKTGLGYAVTDFNADNFLHGIVWCYGSKTGTPPVDGLLFAYRINSNQATQFYFGMDNKTYQRQRSWSTQTWGSWSTDISGNGSASSSGYILFGDYQIAFGKININQFYSAYTLNGSATFYRSFVEPPVVTLTGFSGADGNYYPGDTYVKTITNSGFSASFAYSDFANGSSRIVNYIAIGKGR